MPDFSGYTDFPKAARIFAKFRNHWLGAFWQSRGISVIPNVRWGAPCDWNCSFDGYPVGGTVAVSSVGTQADEDASRFFRDGYFEMLKRLQPETILFYGVVPDYCTGNIIRIPAFQEQLRKRTKG